MLECRLFFAEPGTWHVCTISGMVLDGRPLMHDDPGS